MKLSLPVAILGEAPAMHDPMCNPPDAIRDEREPRERVEPALDATAAASGSAGSQG